MEHCWGYKRGAGELSQQSLFVQMASLKYSDEKAERGAGRPAVGTEPHRLVQQSDVQYREDEPDVLLSRPDPIIQASTS